MKVFKEIGSKERFVDMFQKVNKIKLNEAIGQNYNPNSILEFAFSELKNKKLSVKHSNTQVNGNESFVELLCIDNSGNNISFIFKATSTEGDQEGVFNINEVIMTNFSFDDANSEETIELDENGLRQFNAQHASEFFDIVDEYMDVEDEEPELDEIYEDAVKLIDKVPYKAGSERMVTQAQYADEKPTNANVRVKAPELQKFVQEDANENMRFPIVGGMGSAMSEGDYGEDDIVGQEIKRFNQEIGTDDVGAMDEPEDNEPVEEISEEKKKIILQAYDNLMAKNVKNPSYSPTMVDISAEVSRITGQPVEKKNRVFPREAEPFLEEDEKKSEYPKELGKEFSPEKQYNKKPKKYSKKIKLKEEDDEQISHQPFDNEDGGDIEQLSKEKVEIGDKIQGGLADEKTPMEFDPEQLIKGLEVEMEHTDDPMVAIEIAMDHLVENPEYYTVKDTPEASAQQGAAADAEGKKHPLADILDADGSEEDLATKNIKNGGRMGVNRALKNPEDKEMTDVLLGYEPKNVGDEVKDEAYDFAAQEVDYNNMDAYKKYQQYSQMDFNNLTDDQKEEFFELWKQFKGAEK